MLYNCPAGDTARTITAAIICAHRDIDRWYHLWRRLWRDENLDAFSVLLRDFLQHWFTMMAREQDRVKGLLTPRAANESTASC